MARKSATIERQIAHLLEKHDGRCTMCMRPECETDDDGNLLPLTPDIDDGLVLELLCQWCMWQVYELWPQLDKRDRDRKKSTGALA